MSPPGLSDPLIAREGGISVTDCERSEAVGTANTNEKAPEGCDHPCSIRILTEAATMLQVTHGYALATPWVTEISPCRATASSHAYSP